jgi:hypothetical protein
MQDTQSVSDLSIRGRVDLTALHITKEVVQHVIATLSVVVSCMVSEITSLVNRVIHGTVRTGLLRGVIATVSIVVGGSIVGWGTWVHLAGMIIVAGGRSCKILQVSNHC